MNIISAQVSSFFRVPLVTLRYVRLIDVCESEAKVSKPGNLRRALVRRWAQQILKQLRVGITEIKGGPVGGSVLMVGNHISYLDIPLLLSFVYSSFVTKKEIASWPVFGRAARCVDPVFVSRESKDSRSEVGEAIFQHLSLKKGVITIFPSGTTSIGRGRPWRWGPFQIAKRHDLWVQPFRIGYTPIHKAAFVGKDYFLPHLWRLIRANGVRAAIEFHRPVKIDDPEIDCRKWQQWAQSDWAD